MLKTAYDEGYTVALAAFGLEKYAGAGADFKPAPAVSPLGFFQKAKAHGSNLMSGAKGWLSEPAQPKTTARSRANANPGIFARTGAGQGAARKQVMTSAKGLAPAAALGVGALWAGKKLFGKSDEQKRRERGY